MIAGIGTDIVEIARLERLIELGKSAFLDRWYTPAERAYCSDKARPAAHYAARLAAKEAVAKAIRWQWAGPVPWREIEILHDPTGAPVAQLTGQAQSLAEAQSITQIAVSLSHAQDHATAVAIASVSCGALVVAVPTSHAGNWVV